MNLAALQILSFLLGVVAGIALALLLALVCRHWILHHLHEAIAARELRQREQAGRALIHCEPGAPAA